MTRLLVAAVGRPRIPGLRDAIHEYEGRLRHYFKFESVEIPGAGLADTRAAEAREREGRSLSRKLSTDLRLIALTRDGTPWSTQELASHLGDMLDYGEPGAAFAVGGAHGLAPELVERASIRLRLSRLTLPHELARLILTEQLYRAGTILRGEPYHKGP